MFSRQSARDAISLLRARTTGRIDSPWAPFRKQNIPPGISLKHRFAVADREYSVKEIKSNGAIGLNAYLYRYNRAYTESPLAEAWRTPASPTTECQERLWL